MTVQLNKDTLSIIFGYVDPNDLINECSLVSRLYRACALRALPSSINNHPESKLTKATVSVLLFSKNDIPRDSLRCLRLASLPITNVHIAMLEKFPGLKSLTITYAKGINDISPLAKLPELESVKLLFTGVTDLKPLTTHTQLRNLQVFGKVITLMPKFQSECKVTTKLSNGESNLGQDMSMKTWVESTKKAGMWPPHLKKALSNRAISSPE